jgi:PAS domain-containing protein
MLVSIVQSRGAGCLAAVLSIAVMTAIGVPFHGQLDTTIVVLALLLVVLFMATLWGRGPGMVAAGLGMVCYNFCLLPTMDTLARFPLAQPQHWMALAAFIITASTVGHLSVTAKRRAAEAERQAARLASTYNRSLLEASLDPLVTIGPDGTITDVNAATETVTGHARGELIGTDFSDYSPTPRRPAPAISRHFVRAWCAIMPWSCATAMDTSRLCSTTPRSIAMPAARGWA